jgi:periplasmic protein TonB
MQRRQIMFETSVIHAHARATRGRFSLLTISVIAHTAVIVGAVAYSVASVEFPVTAPDEYSQAPNLMPVLLPPPPKGVENGGAPPRRPDEARPTPPPQQQVNQVTAPPVIPDQTPQLATAVAIDGTNIGGDPNATSTEPPGDPLGDPNSVITGPGGLGPIVAAPAVEQKVYQAHEVTAPVGLYRPSPPYPSLLIKTRMRATVVVRCIIDRNGNVRDPQVIVPASMSPFNDAVLATVRTWRFTPGSLNGVAVESYLNLTVHFSVNRG